MAQSDSEADKMLDVYIYDHLVKKKLHNIAKSFMTEGKVSLDHVGKAIDTPGGLLFEWWSMFWDISIAKTKEKRSESAVEQGLNVYIYDYLVKKKLYHTAESFMPPLRVIFVSINTPGGFLSKWWFVFWDFFIARVTEKHYESVAQAQQGEQMKQPNPVNTVASQPSMDAGTIHHGQMVHGRYQGGVSPALQSRTQQTPENNSGVNLGASPRQQDPLLSQQNNHKRARTGNTVGPFNSQPSTPLTHTPNEGVAITGDMPKGPVMYGSDAIGGLASSANQPMCDDMEAFEDLEDLEDKAEWFLPQVDGNLQQSDMESFGALEDVDIESVVTAINWNPSEFIERQQAKEQEQMKQPNPMNTETSQPHMDHGEMVDGNHQGGSVLASLQQLNPRTQQTPFEAGDGESRKGICNCEKSKCLQLFCECFAAGVYCSTEPPCSCINCHNIPIYKEDVLNSRKKIESRNPLAFAPKIISRSSDPVQETRDDASKTPASGHHRRGCNCKKSKCSNKNCECFQGGVCCSTRCRCIECGNKNQERK